MKNKENTKAVKQVSPETAGSELLKGSTIITKLGGIKVKLTKKVMEDVFRVILNAQEDINADNWEENVEIILDFLENPRAQKQIDNNSKPDETSEEIVRLLTAYINKCLMKLDDTELIKLTYGIQKRREQQQLIS